MSVKAPCDFITSTGWRAGGQAGRRAMGVMWAMWARGRPQGFCSMHTLRILNAVSHAQLEGHKAANAITSTPDGPDAHKTQLIFYRQAKQIGRKIIANTPAE